MFNIFVLLHGAHGRNDKKEKKQMKNIKILNGKKYDLIFDAFHIKISGK